MGDESSFRTRRDDLTGPGPGARAPGGNVRDAEDALAELARMIGDQDPFADFAEVSRAPQQPEPPTRLRAPRTDAPTRAPASPPVERRFEDWQPGRRPAGGREPTLPSQAQTPYGGEGLTQRPRAPEPTVARPPYDPSAAAEDARTAVRQGYGSLATRRAEAPAPTYVPEPTVARGAQGGEAYGQPQYAQPAHAPQGRAAPGRDDEAAGYAYGAKSDEAYDDYDDAYDPTYDEEGYMPPHGEEIYDEEPRRRRGRTALIAVACLMGLGVAATAGIFAYRMGGSESGSGAVSVAGGDAPVIKADATPTKVAAPSPEGVPGGDGQKLIYDRVGNAQPGKEKVVPREEQPVDVNAAAAAAPPAASQAPAAPANASEPKKVRTVAVRADGTVVASAAPAAVPPVTGVAPTAYAPGQNPAPAGLPTPTPVATTPTNGAGVPVASAAQGNAAPAQTAAAGGYVVQVSSQKSEADALGSWKVLQGRYPQLLGNYKATVRKADLGDKGIYYRAQVGPFTSRDDAISLCNNLRAQGGDCVVTKN